MSRKVWVRKHIFLGGSSALYFVVLVHIIWISIPGMGRLWRLMIFDCHVLLVKTQTNNLIIWIGGFLQTNRNKKQQNISSSPGHVSPRGVLRAEYSARRSICPSSAGSRCRSSERVFAASELRGDPAEPATSGSGRVRNPVERDWVKDSCEGM